MTQQITEKNRALRSRSVIKRLLKRIEREDTLQVDGEVYDEISSYLEVRPLLPDILNHQSRSNVRKAQKALVEIEARIDKCLRGQAGVRTRLRLFSRLEFEVKQDLFRAGFITEKSSKPSVEQALALVIPELTNLKEEWKELEELCRSVHKRLLDAKDTMKLLSRLDDNYRWANTDLP